LLLENFTQYSYLVIAQTFNIKIIQLDDVLDIGEELLQLQKIKNDILNKINIKLLDNPINEVKQEILPVEEVVIEIKPKIKTIIKKKVKKPIVIEEVIDVYH
jgi:hypothetical protein